MSNSDDAIEREIVEKGKTAPRITPQMLEDQVMTEYWGRASDLFSQAPAQKALECLTICVITTKNGFTLTGTSACASPENYDAELGRKIARAKAIEQLWPLMGYELKSKLNAV